MWRTTKTNTERTQFKYGSGIDKATQYEWFKEQGIPALEYTDSFLEVLGWLDEGHTVFGRSLLNASCGKGIVVFNPEDTLEVWGSLPLCAVYTKYKKKKREFRVHVFLDSVVAVVEKKKRREFNGERDTKIRNLANGYVFCQEVENEPEGLRTLAMEAAFLCTSAFCGVDIGYNERNNELFVIEVNSAPGIEGTNLTNYVETILTYV